MLDSFFNSVFGWLISWSPKGALIIICFLLTLLTTLVYKYATNQKWVKQMKDEMAVLQKQMKEQKNNPKKMMEIQKELMEKNMKFMMHSFKPLIYTFVPLLILFGWLRGVYQDMGRILFGLSWIWIYLIASIIFSTILRKVLKIY